MDQPSNPAAPLRESRRVRSGAWWALRTVFLTGLLTVGVGMSARAQSLQNKVTASARDSTRYDMAGQKLYLFGAAKVAYEGLELTADRIVLDMKNETASAFGAPDSSGTIVGKPVFKQGGRTIEADSLAYNFRTKEGLIREVRTTEDQLYALAHLSKRHANEEVHSKGGMLTTCDRPRPHYHFAVSRMMVIPDDKIVTGPVIMKVGRVPLPLAAPFGLFPNHKNGAAGVLIPVFGYSDALGYYLLNGGWYQPINDHVDAQLTGDIYSRGSWTLRALTRYRTRYRYSGNVDISRTTLLNSVPEYPDFSRQTNFFVRWNHLMDPKASLTDRFSASVNFGSSGNFSNNFNSTQGDFLSNTFQSNIQWNHLWSGKPYNVAVGMRHSQNTMNKTYDITLPTVTFNVQRVFPADWFRGDAPTGERKWFDNIGLTWSSQFDNRISTTEDVLFSSGMDRVLRLMRNGLRHTAAINTSFKTRAFSINPEVRLTDRMYFDQVRRTYDAEAGVLTTDTVARFGAPLDWSAGVSLTSKLYGMFTFNKGRLKAIRHVITPTAGLSYTPGNDTRITGPFGTAGAEASYSPYEIGIYGTPSPSASGLLTLGLVQSLEAKTLLPSGSGASQDSAQQTTRKIKLLDFLGATTSYDMLKDSVNWSPMNVNARTRILDRVDVNVTSVWDPYATNEQGARINRSQRELDGRLARLSNANLALGFELKSRRYGQSTTDTPVNNNTEKVVEEADPDKGARMNFNLPWHLRVNYSYDLARAWKQSDFTDTQRQSVLFNGDVTILKWWKLGASSGYDLTAGEWTPTTINVYWDMHCWEFNVNVIPLGTRKSIGFRINVKASVLRDLKYEWTRPFGNDGQLLR